MKVLVTGGAGFIGGHLVDALVAGGATVRVIDNFSTGRRENLAHHGADVEVIEGDICDPDAVGRAIEGVELVYHEAAIPSVSRSVNDPVASNRANVGGTVQVLDAARRAGVRKLVYAESSSAYGDTEVLTKVETMTPMPLSPYAISKLAGEHYVTVFGRLYGFETVSLRYFNVFGPRQDPFSQYAAVIPLFITRVLRGERPTIYGDGGQSRDFTYIDNVVEGNILAATSGAGGGEAFNIACGDRLTVNGLLEAVNGILGASVTPVHAEPRPGDIRHSTADHGKARRILGFEPRVPFLEGLRRTVAWYRTKEQAS